MNKTIRTFLFGALGLAFACASASAQALTATTLSAAVTSGSQTVIQVASGTGCPNFSRASNPCNVLVDTEMMEVVAITNSTFFTVVRGVNGITSNHVSGAPIILGSPVNFPTIANLASNYWDTQFTQYGTFEPASVAVNETADVNGQEWYSAIYFPRPLILTGACQYNGNGTLADKMIVILWDAQGNVLANSAVAGVTQTGTVQYQCQDFTGPVAVPAGKYFIGVQGNGTTAASLATYAAGGVPTHYATGKQSGTFGTVAKITTVPTTFTANQGPLMAVY